MPRPSRKSNLTPANEVRIIGGTWRSRRIRFAAGAAIRPTPDRVRETLFNWLGQDLTGFTCLDLFAGSGALGFEAASRGAERVVLLERDRAAYSSLVANREVLDARHVEVICRDAIEFLRSDNAQYDVIFLDPPYSENYWSRLVPLLPARLLPNGLVYYEAARTTTWPEGWQVVKQSRAGQVAYQLVRKIE
jgi:16S rRNA (guanine966-N2)-methyltransferase